MALVGARAGAISQGSVRWHCSSGIQYYGYWRAETRKHASRLGPLQESGIKAIISLQGLYNKENYSDYTQLIERVKAVKNHPALWGYLLWDEPMAADAIETWLAGSAAAVRKRMARIRFSPICCPVSHGGLMKKTSSIISRQISPICSVTTGMFFLRTTTPPMATSINLESIRRQALKYNIPFNNIFLSIPHFDYRDPSEADLRWQVFTSLAYGAKAWPILPI